MNKMYMLLAKCIAIFKIMNNGKLDEATTKIYQRLIEQFGEPIGERPTTYGVPDARVSEKKGGCGCTNEESCSCDSKMNEATPKGYERIVKGLKRSGGVENPWAVAWSMKKKGIKPKKK